MDCGCCDGGVYVAVFVAGFRVGLSPVVMVRAEGVFNRNIGGDTKFSNFGGNLGLSLMLGSQTYTKMELLHILMTPARGDASLILADQLIAAKLNIANGSDPTPISSTITHADSLLSMFSGKLPYNVKPSSAIGQMMVSDANTLDNYNNGLLTPGCSGS